MHTYVPKAAAVHIIRYPHLFNSNFGDGAHSKKPTSVFQLVLYLNDNGARDTDVETIHLRQVELIVSQLVLRECP